MAAATIHTAYGALESGDAGPLLALIGDAFEWVEPDLPGYPLSGTHRGPAGVRRGVLDPLAELLEGLAWRVEDRIDGGERVVVTGTMSGRPVGVGDARWELRFAHVWELQDGEPVRVSAYFDRSRLALAATRRELAEVADDLLEQAAEIRRQWARLGDALRVTGVEADGEHEDAPADTVVVADAPVAASVRLMAVDIAHDGSTREEVEAYLVDEMGVEDPVPILDEVFGPPATPEAEQRAAALEATRLSRLFARNRE